MHSIARRTLCSGIVPVLGLLTLPAFAGPDNSKSPLLTVVKQTLAVYRANNDHSRELTDEEAYELSGIFSEHLDALAGMRAVTLEQMAAKASLIQTCLPSYLRARAPDERSPEMRLLFSLIDDVIAFNKEQVA